MKLNRLIFMLLFALCATDFYAQGVRITEHGNVSAQMSAFVSENRQSPFVDGWRIQIVSTDDRRKMERDKAKFESMYPGHIADWSQDYPYYKVKVGAFRDKMSYYPFLLELKQEFPSAIPVMEKIRVEELLRS